MEPVSGREAIGILAEVEVGHRILTDAEYNYCRRQANSFFKWLKTQGKTHLEAMVLCRTLFEKDIELCNEEDPFAELIWSRGQEAGEMEINLVDAASADFETMVDSEFKSYEHSWDNLFTTNDDGQVRSQDEKYFADTWKRSVEKLAEIVNYLNKLQAARGKALSEGQYKMRLAQATHRLNLIRFGVTTIQKGVKSTVGGGEILYRHWAMATNIINGLRGINKRYTVSLPPQEEEEDDMLDGAQHGIDFDQMVAPETEAA